MITLKNGLRFGWNIRSNQSYMSPVFMVVKNAHEIRAACHKIGADGSFYSAPKNRIFLVPMLDHLMRHHKQIPSRTFNLWPIF